MRKYILLFLFVCILNLGHSQELKLTSKDSIVTSSWMVGIGYNFVDDSGNRFKNLLDFEDQWNAVAFPSRLSVGKYFRSGLGLEAIGTYNKYKKGKLIDRQINSEDIDYWGIDARLSYDLNKIIGETGFFDPYVGVGLGYTDANHQGRGTYNAVVGFRTWFSDRIGLDLNTSGKWAMSNDATNHVQHAASILYRFDMKKELSKKGLEKLALIEENQRITDSINAAKKAEEEARLLAERLAREKEQARLAAEEQAKKDAENRRRAAIQSSIEEVGHAHFNLNSATVNKSAREVLDKLAIVLEENPTVTLKINSHADVRGQENYNQELSEKRAQRTIDYLVEKKGISRSRLTGIGYGQTHLINKCDENIRCPESMHQQNRRSEFEVDKF